jgi:FkbM family methyltransferase
MKKAYLGTDYGGWEIDLNSIKDGDVIIDAGLGEDISFIEELNKLKNIKVIGIDPTEKSHVYVEKKSIDNLTLYKNAIAPKGTSTTRFFKNRNPEHVSESYLNDHGSVGLESYEVSCLSFLELIEKFSPVLIKMDIEGAEYDVLQECVGVKQICVEFHHHCLKSKSFDDTKKMIKFLENKGYQIIASKNEIEYTFLLK